MTSDKRESSALVLLVLVSIYAAAVTIFILIILFMRPHPSTVVMLERMTSIAEACETYSVLEGEYPPSLKALLAKRMGPEPVLQVDACHLDAKGRLCDIWCTPYQYTSKGVQAYQIISAGRNGKFGDADDILFSPDEFRVGN